MAPPCLRDARAGGQARKPTVQGDSTGGYKALGRDWAEGPRVHTQALVNGTSPTGASEQTRKGRKSHGQ